MAEAARFASWLTRRQSPLWPALLAAAAMATLMELRVLAVDRAYGAYMGCAGCLDRSVWASDLRPVAVLVVLAAVALWSRRPWWRVLWGMAGTAVLALYVIDLGVFMLLGFRLRVLDLMRYGGDTYAAWTVVAPLLKEPRWMLLVVATVAALVGWWWLMTKPRAASWREPALVIVLSLPLLALSRHLPDAVYVHADGYRDVFAGLMPSGVNRAFSAAFRSAHAGDPQRGVPACAGGSASPRSVTLVVIESLSAYHSRLHGGVMDALPNVDRLAQQGSFVETFHANGFTTDHGLIALLTGRVPLPAPGRYDSSDAYGGYERPRPADYYERLHAAGYSTQFFTTGRLDFLDKGSWMKGLGFQHVEGAEHSFYQHLPRGGFDDVGDRYLYDRFLQWFDTERSAGRPQLSVLLTVSTHPPFRVPGTSIADEEAAFRYADREVARLVRELDRRGYFQNGVLIVTGDHRTMTPLDPRELERFGSGAVSRVPFVVVGRSEMRPGRVDGRWQQTDFLPSLAYWAALDSCIDRYQGRFAGPDPRPAEVVVHVQGHRRDRLHVWLQAKEEPFELLLDGDDTRWVGDVPVDPFGMEVLAEINRERLALPRLRADFIESLLGPR